MAFRKPLKQRFEKLIFYSPDGCWYWTGCANKDGYGIMRGYDPYKYEQTHRLSYKLYKGVIPKDMCVCHSCDNPLCVNPDHLWLGTHLDNMADMTRKKRHANTAGENHGWSILTDNDVILIRDLKSACTYKELSILFGCTISAISHAVSGRSWKHLL